MEDIIKKRVLGYSNTFTIPILLMLEVIAIYFAYIQKPILLILIIALYIFIPSLLSYQRNMKYSWGVSRGIFIMVDKIFQRKGVINFYIVMYVLIYAMGFSMVLLKDWIGIITVALLLSAKIILSFLAYGISKYEKYYEDFDKFFIQ